MIFSIDQNSHSLWDTLPKLEALSLAGHETTHFVEDVDVAFTEIGVSKDSGPRIIRERYYPSGGSDWGAALFYHEFLGRQPLELRRLEPGFGMKAASLAKKIDMTLEDLYAQYSVSDNYMLIGPSYAGDRRCHRVIGDISVGEAGNFIREILDTAERNCLNSFPSPDSRERTRQWFSRERSLVDKLIDTHSSTTLDRLYCSWLDEHVTGEVSFDVTSSLFTPERDSLLGIFIQHYELASELYNRAIDETGQAIHKLDIDRGELPFHAVMRRQDRIVRAEVFLVKDRLRAADIETAPDAGSLRGRGIFALPGKAMVLPLQVRLAPNGSPLALPHHGSLYMPASHRLELLLREHSLIDAPARPVMRIRFRFFDRLGDLETPVRLPQYLAGQFDSDVIPASELSRNYRDIIDAARQRLADLEDPPGRDQWIRNNFSDQTRSIEQLEKQKLDIVREDPRDPRAREIWLTIRSLQAQRLRGLVERLVTDYQLSRLDFCDSRGAICPWAVAMGGEEFYRHVLSRAEITEETADSISGR
jgi:hypothetical protein